MADIFLSYARPDEAAAQRIARQLTRAGWSVWYDRELPAHRAYADVITKELEAASSVLVLWSSAATGSEWVRSEANRARELHKLVQARLDDARVPMPFDQIQCADLTRDAKGRAGWSQVRKSIEALVGGDRAAPASPDVAEPVTRRTLVVVAGAAFAAAGVGGYFWLSKDKADRPSPEAALLLQKGIDMLQNNDVFAADNPGSLRDAIALLTEATKADPNAADGWGALALAYAALKRVSPLSERPGLDVRCRSAAKRAFDIEPRNPRATGALLLLRRLYRNWLDAERADQEALKNTPKRVPLLLFVMSEMLRSVGRCKEAAATSAQFDRKKFIIPGADEQVLVDRWSAGDLQGADEALQLAVEHWPQHPEVWRSRISYLMYSGRASDALELLHNDAQRPSSASSDLTKTLEATAAALTGRMSPQEAAGRNLAYLKANSGSVFQVVHACAALGDATSLFQVLEGYYFGRGAWSAVAPAGGDDDRETDELFQPPMKSVWTDPRFAQLVERIGLEDYWRRSGTLPDFRRR